MQRRLSLKESRSNLFRRIGSTLLRKPSTKPKPKIHSGLRKVVRGGALVPNLEGSYEPVRRVSDIVILTLPLAKVTGDKKPGDGEHANHEESKHPTLHSQETRSGCNTLQNQLGWKTPSKALVRKIISKTGKKRAPHAHRMGPFTEVKVPHGLKNGK